MDELPINQILCGDSIEVMKGFPAERIDLTMFSPPYWGLRVYGVDTEKIWGGRSDCEHEWVEDKMGLVHENRNFSEGSQEQVVGDKPTTFIRKYDSKVMGTCIKCGAWKGQLGLEPTWRMYVEHMVEVCREVKRVLKKTGSMYLVLGDTYAGSGQCHKIAEDRQAYKKYSKDLNFPYKRPTVKTDLPPKCLVGIPWRVAFSLIEDGWVLRETIIWHKPNSMPGSQRDRLTRSYEEIFHFVKNTGKALLWRNELTGGWVGTKPNQQYFHVDTKELQNHTPPKDERYETDEHGIRRLIWKPLWRGFDYYYDLDIIREPHKSGITRWGGDIMRMPKREKEKQGLAKALLDKDRLWRNPKGKNPGDVLKLDSVACPSGPQRWEREGTNRVEARFNPLGKNPGDVFQTKKEPYIGNNPHRMRLQRENYVALDPSRPMDLSHPKGKNPGDVFLKQDNVPSKNANLYKGFNARYIPREDGKNPTDFWSINTKPFKGAHFAVYPEAICVIPIKSSCPPNGIVLDPMCGSGTTLVVAEKLGRRWIGIDLNPEYVKIARNRLASMISVYADKSK